MNDLLDWLEVDRTNSLGACVKALLFLTLVGWIVLIFWAHVQWLYGTMSADRQWAYIGWAIAGSIATIVAMGVLEWWNGNPLWSDQISTRARRGFEVLKRKDRK